AYFDANRRRWDEVVDIHLKSGSGAYRVADFRAGRDVLLPIESGEIGDVDGRSLLHLQCHFGLDTLGLARRGATVTGLDFAPRAIAAARALSAETGVPGTFVEGNLYDAPALIDGRFDIVYVTWGAINWLPDIARWAAIAAGFLNPGGFLYLLEGHPAAEMLEPGVDGRLTPTYAYFPADTPLVFDDDRTYTGDPDRLTNTRAYEWIHPLGAIVTALAETGLAIDFLHEHDRLVWQMFPSMTEGADRMFRLPPDHPPVPLAYSLKASRR
ncbi:MAG: class I SAM-dependent methyltransferase, partial [Alphaproteobacteria bacterium]